MNTLDKQYTDLLQDIIDNGVKKGDRTGTGTISVFGRTVRHKMSEGFPLLTTKKMYFKGIVTELLWFLQGDTNIKYLVDNGCHIWDGDAYKNYCKYTSANSSEWNEWMRDNGDGTISMFTHEEFINKIKTDDKFAKKWGDLGPIYGKQWRSWNKQHVAHTDENYVVKFFTQDSVDQIQTLINDLKTNPDSRRLIVNAWNVNELDKMVLPPCHYGFQVYTRELSSQERKNIYNKSSYVKDVFPTDESGWNSLFDDYNIPTRAISLMWNQRSVDTFLGLPFNIASYGLLLEILAKEVNMVPDELIGNLGDVHLYNNHIDAAKEQIGRKYTWEERKSFLIESMGEKKYNEAISELVPFGGGMSEYYDSHKIPHTTRQPFELPKLKINTEFWETESGECGVGLLNTNLTGFEISDFQIENYQSHPSIKAPLSN